MRMGTLTKVACSVLACAALLVAGDADAGNTSACVVEIAPPPPGFGADPAMLKNAAESEVQKGVQASLLRSNRRVVISVAVLRTAPAPVVCSVNATVRDAKTGAMLAVISTDARAAGPVSVEQRKELAYAAVRSAVRSVPRALENK